MNKKENKAYVFLVVSEDGKLHSISSENLAIICEGLGWDIQLGTYLPGLVEEEHRDYFVEQLRQGFSGQCFSFEIVFPCKKTHQKNCEVLLVPALQSDSAIPLLGLAIKCADEFDEDLEKIREEGLLGLVFNSSSMGICITDRNGKFVEVNQEYCRIYGYKKEELIGNCFTMVVLPEQRDLLKKIHSEFFTHGEDPPQVFEVVTKSGKIIKVGGSAEKLVTKDGEEYKVTTIQDLTGMKELEDHLESIGKNIPGIILRYLLRPDGTDQLLYMSEGSNEFSGVSKEDAMRDSSLIWRNIHPDFVPSVVESIRYSAQTLQTWKAEWKYIYPKDQSERWHRGKGNPKRLEDGSVVWDSIIFDISYEVEVGLELKESKSRFEKLISDGVEMIAIIDQEGKYTYNSPAYFTMLGYDPVELKGFQAFSLIHPDDVPVLYSEFERVFSEMKIFSQPYRIRKKNGEYIWLKSIGTNLLDDPMIHGIVVNSTDVTELIQVKMDLESSEKQYKYLFENNPGAMMIWELSTGYILDVNDRTCQLYGYTREEFLTKTVYDVRPTEEYIKFKKLSEEQQWLNYSGSRLYEGVSRHMNKAGDLLDVKINAQMIDYKGKRVSLVLLTDVTQQLKEEVRSKLLQSVVTHANDAVIITEAEPFGLPGPKIVFVNEAFTRMTGYTSEEVLGKSPRILQGPKTDQQQLDLLRDAMKHWRSCEITTVNYKKTGEEFWTNFSISPVANANGWYTHWISIQRDVTKIKQEEQRRGLESKVVQIFAKEPRFLSSLEKSLELLLSTSGLDAGEIWLINSDQTKLNLISKYAVSEEGERFFASLDQNLSFKKGEGLPGKVWEAMSFVEVNGNADPALFPRKGKVMASGMICAFGLPLEYNHQVIGVVAFGSSKKCGWENLASEDFASMGNVLGAEIHRKKIEDELSQVFDTAQDIICITGFDGMFKKVNKGAVNLLGYTEEELLSHRFDYFIHPEDRLKSEDGLDLIIDGNNLIHHVDRYLTKAGDVVWLDWNSTVMIEEELIYSVAKNITEEKELEILLENANKMARIGFWDVNMLTGNQFWSKVTFEIFEIDSNQAPSVEEGIAFYSQDDIPVLSRCFQECAKQGTPYDLELSITTAKGNKVWIRTIGQAEFREGVCRRVFGSIQDITDLKLAKIELEKAFEQKNAILESIGDAFFSIDQQGQITYWNKEANLIFGGKKAEVLGLSIWDIHPINTEPVMLEQLTLAKSTHEVVRFELFFRKINKWLEISIYPSEIGQSVYLKDATIRKTSEELIRRSNERFENVGKATRDAVWDYDFQKEHMYWGEGFKTLFGYSDLGDLTFTTWSDKIHPDDFERVTQATQQAFFDPECSNIENEYRFLKSDGTYANVADRGIIIRNDTGEAIRVVGAVSDVTERKAFESSLKSLNERLEARAVELSRSNAELEQFAYVASHDLQEPLRMVTSFLSQLEIKYQEQLDDRAKKYIHFAVDGAKRMRQIILDLLEFSRVGRIQEEISQIPVENILTEVCSLQSGLIEAKKAKVSWGVLPVIFGAKTPLIQIFQNLISNAVKYSRDGIRPEVKVSCTESPDFWEFAVQDNGIGIEKESLEKIFVIFQRLHTKDQYAGTGIGLAIVKKLIENMGGKIWVESTPGEGSTFRFTLRK